MGLTPINATKADTGRAGIVLAGGRSERFPTVDKALAPLGEKPLLRHVIETLLPAVDELVINCRREQEAAFSDVVADLDVRFALDPISDRGPLVGLETALTETETTYAAVVPCDMPTVPAAFIDYLFSRATNKTGAVPTVDGAVQPVPAVVHVRAAAAACRTAQRQNAAELQGMLPELDPFVVPERVVEAHVDPPVFRDINTPEELAAARKATTEQQRYQTDH